MRLKRIVAFICKASTASLLGLALAAAANAATYNAGTLTTTPWLSTGSIIVPGSFLDTYNFNIVPFNDTAAAAVTLDLQLGSLELLHISNLGLNLFDATNTHLATVSGSPASWEGSLAAGNYHFDVTGTADGVAGGAYLFSLAAVPAVPEPSQWLMMAAGLGVITYVRRRQIQRG